MVINVSGLDTIVKYHVNNAEEQVYTVTGEDWADEATRFNVIG